MQSLHVAITGASSGIGRALALEYSRAGASVSLVARRRHRLEALARELGGRVHVAAVDLSDAEHAADWIAAAEAELGPIDVLVNNAGQVVAGRALEVGVREIEALIALDLVVPLALIHAVLPSMIARDKGTIVNITSTGALAPNPGMVHYSAAKAGLAAASESLRGELRRTNVRVLTVYPGPTETAMLSAAVSAYPLSRIIQGLPRATPEDLALRIRLAVERGSARLIYPCRYALFRHLPALTRWLLDRLTPPPMPAQSRPLRMS